MPVLTLLREWYTMIMIMRYFKVLVFCSALAPSAIFADLIAVHLGMNDPTTEGWTENVGAGGGVTTGAVNDGGTGAWFVDDNSTALNSILIYSKTVTAGEIAEGNSKGWALTTTIRVSSDEELGFDGSPFVSYRDGTTGWQMSFGLDAAGDTVVRLFTGATTGPTATLSGNSSYNTLSLVYDPNVGSADFFVNGVETVSNYTGFSSSATAVLWGAGRSPDRGQGNFNLVSFSTVPEPSSSAILSTLAVLTLMFRRRVGR